MRVRELLQSEILVLLGGLASLGFLPDHGGVDVMLCAVAVAGARFGFGAGGLAGATAGAIALIPSGYFLKDFLLLGVDRRPLMLAVPYLMMGILVGMIGDAQRTMLRKAQAQRDRISSDYEQLAQRHQVLSEAKQALDRSIVGQFRTIASLYEAAREIESLDATAILQGALRLVGRFLDAEDTALYLFSEEGRLQCVECRGAAQPMESPLENKAFGVALQGKVFAVHSREEYAQSQVLMAVSLVFGDGRPRGLISVEKLPFSKLTPGSIEALKMIADWTARNLATSEAYQESQSLDPETGLYRVSAMSERFIHEWTLANRYHLPLSAMLLRLEQPDEKNEVIRALKEGFRTIDLVGHYRTEDSFLVVLPVTPREGAEITAERLRTLTGIKPAVCCNQDKSFRSHEEMLQELQRSIFGVPVG